MDNIRKNHNQDDKLPGVMHLDRTSNRLCTVWRGRGIQSVTT